jgi:effector-binding domain-containing protein
MDKMVGADFEKGLSKMKTVAESMPVKPKMKIEASMVSGQTVLTIRDTCPSSEISKTLGSLYGEISMYMDKEGLKQVSQPFAIYHSYSPETTDMEAGIPVDKMGKSNGRIKAGEIAAGNVVIADYYGPYEGSAAAHSAIDEWVKTNGKTVTGAPWEVYVTDPGVEKDPSKWLTQVVYPIQ